MSKLQYAKRSELHTLFEAYECCRDQTTAVGVGRPVTGRGKRAVIGE